MLEALLQDRVDFVALLLDCSYVNLDRFMKSSILQFWLPNYTVEVFAAGSKISNQWQDFVQ